LDVYRDLEDLPRLVRSVVTIGNFDGVHRGHQGVLREAVAEARRRESRSVVLTFVPHPVRVLARGREPARLTPLERKLELMAEHNVDVALVLPFDRRVAGLEPAEFARSVLARGAGAGVVIVGGDFRFGRERAGDIGLLSSLGPELGFEVRSFEPVRDGGEPISSTRIRTALADGRVGDAARLLGRPHEVSGVVVLGDRRGRTLGFPTANLAGLRSMLPGMGVFACWAGVGGVRRMAAVNIGDRPTFGRGRSVEAFLLDFDGDLYGRELTLSFVARLRADERFDGVDALVAQIGRDVERTREALGRGAAA
jgi:riboflavin kinase/FMN adenylyltransferase